jgi:hypothetical protein
VRSEQENNPSTELAYPALKASPYDRQIRIVPSDASLACVRGPESPRKLLSLALQDGPIGRGETVIISTPASM